MNFARSFRYTTASIALLIAPAALAQNDRINDQPTSWWYGYGSTESSIDTAIGNNQRPFNITHTSGNYDVLYVSNNGEYAATGADAYWGMSTSSLSLNLSLGNNRIIDLEPVDVLAGTWSAVVVDNSGATAAPGWDWETGLTYSAMINWRSANGLRPIDVDVYGTLAGTRYSIVAVPNTGSNQQGWWWDFGVTEAQVTSFLTSRGARLIDIDIADTNPLTFNVIMVSQNTGGGWWHPGLTSSQVTDLLNQTGGRLTCLQRYTNSASQTRFAVAIVDNANPLTRRIRQHFDDRVDTGVWGFMAKRVGGSTLAALNQDYEYHPASMLKILHATYVIDRCAANNENLDADVTVIIGSSDCPNGTGSVQHHPLDDAMRQMMRNSDNHHTKAIEDRYGRNILNAYADATLDLDSTQINTTLGCLCQPGMSPNDMTCRDGVSIYEQITDGSLFNQTWQDVLFNDIMLNFEDRGFDGYPHLEVLLNEEAANTNLTPSELADFTNLIRISHKSGGSSCGSPNTGNSTFGAWVSIPFKAQIGSAWVLLPREYTIAMFVNSYDSDNEEPELGIAREEILREEYRAALETWDSACSTPVITNEPDNTVVTEGDDASLHIGMGAGVGTRTYQWQVRSGTLWRNIVNVPGVTGGTTTTLTFTNADETHEGLYRCVVSSACGTDTSSTATLTVNPPSTGCDTIDFNGDDLFPDVQDIADFIAVFGGAGCPTGPGQCGDIDFNNDGLFPDVADIESLIRVFGGGPCL